MIPCTYSLMLNHHFPKLIKWTDGWIQATNKLEVHFTRFEQMARDKDNFIDRIIGYYGGDIRFFSRSDATTQHKGIDYHRRSGTTDGWKMLMTPQQIEQANRLIPNHFWSMFDWQP